MCNLIYFSTTCPDDLAGDFGTYRLRRPEDHEHALTARALRHPHVWYLESGVGGCSCHFRCRIGIAGYDDYRFAPPEEWEEFDPVAAQGTKDFYARVSLLIGRGYEVDLVTTWSDEFDDELIYDVSISQVTPDEFWFFDYAIFRFSA